MLINGTTLKHENKITLSDSYHLSNLDIQGELLSTSLQGRAGREISLDIKYKEYEPGDATVYIADGEIKTKSKSGKPVLINNITGSIPEDLGLTIKTGVGTIELSKLKGRQNISINSGVGDIELSEFKGLHDISINSGTGDIRLVDCNMAILSASTGTGSITLSNNQIDKSSIKTGTGNIILSNNALKQQDLSTGTGRVIRKGDNSAPKDKRSI